MADNAQYVWTDCDVSKIAKTDGTVEDKLKSVIPGLKSCNGIKEEWGFDTKVELTFDSKNIFSPKKVNIKTCDKKGEYKHSVDVIDGAASFNNMKGSVISEINTGRAPEYVFKQPSARQELSLLPTSIGNAATTEDINCREVTILNEHPDFSTIKRYEVPNYYVNNRKLAGWGTSIKNNTENSGFNYGNDINYHDDSKSKNREYWGFGMYPVLLFNNFGGTQWEYVKRFDIVENKIINLYQDDTRIIGKIELNKAMNPNIDSLIETTFIPHNQEQGIVWKGTNFLLENKKRSYSYSYFLIPTFDKKIISWRGDIKHKLILGNQEIKKSILDNIYSTNKISNFTLNFNPNNFDLINSDDEKGLYAGIYTISENGGALFYNHYIQNIRTERQSLTFSFQNLPLKPLSNFSNITSKINRVESGYKQNNRLRDGYYDTLRYDWDYYPSNIFYQHNQIMILGIYDSNFVFSQNSFDFSLTSEKVGDITNFLPWINTSDQSEWIDYSNTSKTINFIQKNNQINNFILSDFPSSATLKDGSVLDFISDIQSLPTDAKALVLFTNQTIDWHGYICKYGKYNDKNYQYEVHVPENQHFEIILGDTQGLYPEIRINDTFPKTIVTASLFFKDLTLEAIQDEYNGKIYYCSLSAAEGFDTNGWLIKKVEFSETPYGSTLDNPIIETVWHGTPGYASWHATVLNPRTNSVVTIHVKDLQTSLVQDFEVEPNSEITFASGESTEHKSYEIYFESTTRGNTTPIRVNLPQSSTSGGGGGGGSLKPDFNPEM